MLAVGRCAVARGPVKVPRRVIARFGLSVAQPGRNVAVLCRQARFPTAHARQLIRLGIVSVGFGVSVALLGLSVTDVRGQVAVAPFDITLARRGQGVVLVVSQGPSVGHWP
jgi:hypothetical protein